MLSAVDVAPGTCVGRWVALSSGWVPGSQGRTRCATRRWHGKPVTLHACARRIRSLATGGWAAALIRELAVFSAAWAVMVRERLDTITRGGYVLVWVIRPVFDLSIAGLVYAGGRRELLPYVVVALAANAVLWVTLFWVAEVLDRERMRGTLPALFLAPCARLSWLLGFAAAGVTETVAASVTVVLAGALLFGVRFDPDLLSLAVILPLYLLAVGGLGIALSGAGLLLKKANQLSNLVFPLVLLLGGVYYPVTALPEPLRLLARALPIGYGMEALAAAVLHRATLRELAPSLIPLALFALAGPLLGLAVFTWIDRAIRHRGELDVY